MKPQLLLLVMALGLAACAETSTAISPPSATTALRPVTAELAGLNFEVHAQPG